MVTANNQAANLLSGTFGVAPAQRRDYVIEDPVLVVSRSFTYHAPEEMLAVPLRRPTVVTFGRQGDPDVQTHLPRVHLVLPDVVEDRLEANEQRSRAKRVNVGDLHGAIIYRDQTLFYRHCCELPTVIAERILDSTRISTPDTVVPLRLGQTIGLGATQDAFGGLLWWYYLRICSLEQLKRRANARAN